MPISLLSVGINILAEHSKSRAFLKDLGPCLSQKTDAQTNTTLNPSKTTVCPAATSWPDRRFREAPSATKYNTTAQRPCRATSAPQQPHHDSTHAEGSHMESFKSEGRAPANRSAFPNPRRLFTQRATSCNALLKTSVASSPPVQAQIAPRQTQIIVHRSHYLYTQVTNIHAHPRTHASLHAHGIAVYAYQKHTHTRTDASVLNMLMKMLQSCASCYRNKLSSIFKFVDVFQDTKKTATT